MIGLLCKGSTTDFDSVCLGSNPSNPTKNASVFTEVFYLHLESVYQTISQLN